MRQPEQVPHRSHVGRNFLGQTRWTKPSKRVGVRSHFFKIVVREAPGGELITLTVLLPNKGKGLGKGGRRCSSTP